jgi:hypothetical protein
MSVLVIIGVGKGVTVIDVETTAVQLLVLVTVTLYPPAAPTDIEAVVAPVLHKYVPPPLAVRVAVAPAQMIPSLFATPDVSVLDIVAAIIDGATEGQL